MPQKNPMLFLTAFERPVSPASDGIPPDLGDADLAKLVFDDVGIGPGQVRQARALWRARHPPSKLFEQQLLRIAHAAAYADEA